VTRYTDVVSNFMISLQWYRAGSWLVMCSRSIWFTSYLCWIAG